MILRVNIHVPKPAAYIVAAQMVPSDWVACSVPNLREFAARYPGWSLYQAGGVSCGWRGAQMIQEADVCSW